MTEVVKYKCVNCNTEKDRNEYYKYNIRDINKAICKNCSKLFKNKNDIEDNLKMILPKLKIDEKIGIVIEPIKDTLNDIKILYPKGEYMVTAIFGSSKSGKTYLLNHIYNELYKDYDLKILFSVNSHIDNYNTFNKGDGIIVDGFKEKLINMLQYINKKCKNYFSFLCVLDDEINMKFNLTLKNLVTTFRNSNFTTFISLQSHILLAKTSRNNLHRIICLKLNSTEEIREICERLLYNVIQCPSHIKNKFEKIEYLINFYKTHTENYNCFIIDNLDNKVYKYRAP